MNTFYVENLVIKDPTCYRSNKPTCVDYLMLTNQKPLFVKSSAFDSGFINWLLLFFGELHLRIHWRLSTILKIKKKAYEVLFFDM